MEIEIIQKEEIPNLKFEKSTNKLSPAVINKLSDATRLGNEFKSKAAITFNTDKGLKKVETTVWLATDSHVQLKGDVIIPISSIEDIAF